MADFGMCASADCRMRTIFRAYVPPTAEELKSMWQESLFAFDANVLLNIYRYSDDIREQLLVALEKLSNRARLPHQFALEFAQNRVKVIGEQASKCRNAISSIKKLFEPHEVLEQLEAREKALQGLISNDPYFHRVCEVLKDKIGATPSSDELSELHEEARRRLTAREPPGYMDKAKGEPECFGDCIGWLQLIEIAKTETKGIIFVSDDKKEDWWESAKGLTVGIRYALREEFWRETNRPIHMYDFHGFLKHAKEYRPEQIEISAALISEVARQHEIVAEEERQRAHETAVQRVFSEKREPPKEIEAIDSRTLEPEVTAAKEQLAEIDPKMSEQKGPMVEAAAKKTEPRWR